MAKIANTPKKDLPAGVNRNRLDSLAHVRSELARLYRDVISPNPKLKPTQVKLGRTLLLNVRDILLAESGATVPSGTVINNNTLVVPGGLQRTDELLARFARPREALPHETLVQNGSVLPAEVCSGQGGHGTPVAVCEGEGGRE